MVEDTMFSGESKNIEYKVSLPDKSEKYMKTIVAFANTQGGKLIVGVDDKTHQIVGVENDVLFQMMDGIANAVSDSCVPQIIPDIEPQTVDGKTVIVVSVEAGKNRPYYLKSKGKDNGTYIRVAGTSRQAFPEKIKELEMEGARISWDELTCVGYPVSEEAMVEVEQIEWLFYPFIPFGKVTIIQGDPGEGKTTMVLQIIAKLTKGEAIFPRQEQKIEEKNGAEMPVDSNVDNLMEPVNVIYQTAEDGLGDTIKPRLLAAGADCSRVLVIDDREQPLTMLDIRLEEAIVQTKARLVVLDPIQGFLGAEVDMHRANEIRPLMKRVAVLAEKYHCAIILIGHMNKNSNGKSSYRGLGSIDFQAAARSVLIVGRIKDEPEVRVVCHVKSSLAPEGKSIAFRLDKDNGFEWIGEYDISADDLLSGDSRGQKSRKAKEFLLEILADGGMAQKKIEEEAEKRGIKKKTLRNAKLELEIDSVKRGNQWFWMLSE